MFLNPKYNKDKRIITAFYSIQETKRCKGKECTSVFKALANAIAITTAEYESLHWPKSKSLGKPPVVPVYSGICIYYLKNFLLFN